jgi:hypothetical protein
VPQISLRISDELEAKLRAFAETRDVDRSVAMRAMLKAGVGMSPISIAASEAISLLSAKKKQLFGVFANVFGEALKETLLETFGAEGSIEDMDDEDRA